MGPVWDYDLAYGNANYCDAWKTDGWGYQFNSVCGGDGFQIPFWWDKMMQDTLFQNHLRCRWENLKPVVLDTSLINNYIDSMATRLNESQQRNYTIWPILGSYVWPNYYIGSNYISEVDTLKWWIKNRYEWLDSNWPGNLIGCGFTGISELESASNFVVYPNPFNSELTITSNTFLEGNVEIEITDVLGARVQQLTTTFSNSSSKIELNSDLPKGLYYLTCNQFGRKMFVKKIVKD